MVVKVDTETRASAHAHAKGTIFVEKFFPVFGKKLLIFGELSGIVKTNRTP